MQESAGRERSSSARGGADRGAAAWVWPALVLAAFLLAQWPLARVLQFHHPDEKHYTDAALRMVESGDYWTPRRYDHTLRPQKPLGTYWSVAGAFRLLGVSPLSSRLPSLAAGALLLALTHALARTATGNPGTALLALCLVATQFAVLLCANRTTPDIFLTAALTLGFLGLARCLRNPVPGASAVLFLLGGAALAVAAKGLLGVVFLVFAVAVLARERRDLLRRHRPALGGLMLLWAGLVVAWFALMGIRHGSQFLLGFVHDQVVGRLVTGRWWHKPIRLAAYALLQLLLFLPWWLVLLFRRNGVRGLRRCAVPPQLARAFLGWALLCTGIFGLGNKVTARYILSCAPLGAVWIADAYRCGRRTTPRSFRAARARPALRSAGVAALLALTLLAILPGGGGVVALAVPLAAWGAVLGIACVLSRYPEREIAVPASWSVLALAILPWLTLLLRQPFQNALEPQLAQVLREVEREAAPGIILCTDKPAVLARTRLHLGRSLALLPMADLGTNPAPAAVTAVVAAGPLPSGVALEAFKWARTVRLPRSEGFGRHLRREPLADALRRFLREGFPTTEYRVYIRRRPPSPPEPRQVDRESSFSVGCVVDTAMPTPYYMHLCR